MRVRLFPLFVIVLVWAFAAAGQTVIESKSSVSIKDKNAVVVLALESDTELSRVPVSIELLETVGTVRAQSTTSNSAIRKGKQALEFRLPIGDIAASAQDDLAWYRLRYRAGNSTGTISLSQLISDLFELRIIASYNILSGMTYRVRVRAINPFTGQPAAGVMVETAVELDLAGEGEQKLKLNGSGETDADGFAIVDFTIPAETNLDDNGEIKVVGRKNGIVREAEEELMATKGDLQFLIMTDKPIYQPEQMLNVRGILLKGGEAKTVLAGSEIEFRITDEDDTVLYREKVRSSEFGIASIGWKIPVSAKLGDYSIEIRDENGDRIGGYRVRVSRYDLPNFVVEAKPAKAYYLPGENEAEVEIRADYLFGKPVTKGKVRVVEETSREWNWKEQKYDIDEGQIREGEADAEGRYIAKFDLKAVQEELKDDNGPKYKDIKFAAYFTDLTTNKTEQRRFDVRVSREPIHVYFIGDADGLNPAMPINAYVSTFYADGTPAECDVEISASIEDEDKFKTVGRLRTNSYGAGKITMSRPNIGKADDGLDFRIIAKDKNGRRGTFQNAVSFDEDEAKIQIATDRTIYKPGETMTVKIDSTIKSGPVYVDVVTGWSVIDSRIAELKDGRAVMQIPYSDSFKGELKIAAFAEEGENDIVRASRGVIFPARQGITVDASFDKAVYKPNEEATVKFGIVDAIGQTVETALGVVVLDKAVEERARTDSEFGGMWRGLSGWLGYGDGFGSVNVKDLNELDLTKPISDELQLVAEVILHDNYYYPNIFRSNSYYSEAKSVFAAAIKKQFDPVSSGLNNAYEKRSYLHPVDDASLRSILSSYNIDFDQMRDPWGMGYKAEFSVNKSRDILTVISAGPDKKFETKDDFTAFSTGFEYFTPMGQAIDTVVRNYNARTGGFIQDEKTLFSELGFRELPDRFGRPYKIVFEGQGRYLKIRLRSAGADGKFETYDWAGDDFYVWTNQVDYFAPVEKKISDSQRSVKRIPMNEAEFLASLKTAGIDFDELRDGYGNPLYITVQQTSRYWDKITLETVQNFGEAKTTERRTITPVTQQIIQFTIRSNGKDARQGTYDDFTLTQIVHVLSEQAKDNPKPVPVFQPIVFSGSTGSIAGIVTDPQGAVVPNANVTAINSATSVSRSTTTNDSGNYLIANLEAGSYSVKVKATGFKDSVLTQIPVKANETVQANVTLSAGGVSETVEVTGVADSQTETTNASISVNGSRQIASLPLNARNALSLIQLRPGTAGTEQEKSTPRLREYFPETLLWQPEVLTDANGKAQIKFRMADNITTWKMYTIASTKNGRIGVAEKEVTAFQSFFVDLDPPKFLTEGDEIYLPAQVRNYTEKKQRVDVTMGRADWFSIIGSDKQQIDVETNGSQNAVFGFKAVSPVKDGKQRVTAVAQTDSDAIEKPVTVRPNGQEVVRTESKISKGGEKFDIGFPANALPGTQRAELKIYPNLFSHVTESVEGLLQRPYGCGEQTISSTYPNLMILKFVKPESILAKKARKYLQTGYERLLGYQVADGGFTYWGGKDKSDVALTAYALRFLNDAKGVIDVDEDVIKRAEDWLIKQQRADGSWTKRYYYDTADDVNRTQLFTAYVVRILAMRAKGTKNANGESVIDKIEREPLQKALNYLKSRAAEINEPYALSLFGLALLDSGNTDDARAIAARLEKLAIAEGNAIYWNLETNTPFYGWGTAGRIETTALVVQLLIGATQKEQNPKATASIGKATLFLLKNKDRYGVWYSTQTTINVLDAILASVSSKEGAENQKLEVLINGESVQTIETMPDRIEPVIIDLTDKLNAAGNDIEIKSTTGSPIMSQLVASHYIDWKDSEVSNVNINQSRALRLDYKCDKTNAAIMQEINCSVEAERVGFKGYGMLLAEIGTPPGADVSRESLEKAIESDWSISRYDILPDRIVVYMWSKAGGTRFNFKFKPRYGINAQTPASIVYDYYNPEAQATIKPMKFLVK